jgi:hypothetical protein
LFDGNAPADSLDGSDDLMAHRLLVGPSPRLQVTLMRDDVIFAAPRNGACSRHGRLNGRALATDNGLQRLQQLRGADNRLLGRFRPSAMAADTAHRDGDAISTGKRLIGSHQ